MVPANRSQPSYRWRRDGSLRRRSTRPSDQNHHRRHDGGVFHMGHREWPGENGTKIGQFLRRHWFGYRFVYTFNMSILYRQTRCVYLFFKCCGAWYFTLLLRIAYRTAGGRKRIVARSFLTDQHAMRRNNKPVLAKISVVVRRVWAPHFFSHLHLSLGGINMSITCGIISVEYDAAPSNSDCTGRRW